MTCSEIEIPSLREDLHPVNHYGGQSEVEDRNSSTGKGLTLQDVIQNQNTTPPPLYDLDLGFVEMPFDSSPSRTFSEGTAGPPNLHNSVSNHLLRGYVDP